MISLRRCAASASFTAALMLPAALQAQLAQHVQEDTATRGHVWPALGLRVGAPQKASAAVGVVLGETWQRNGHEHTRNLAVFAEPGLSGGRATVAYLDHAFGSFGSGFGVGASVLRTWRDPWGVKENVTYAGGDVLLWPILFVGPRIGIFRGVSGVDPAKRWVVTFDFGIGL